jgi:hypothetical protein
MFSHPLDPPCVKSARKRELRHIKHWIKQAARAQIQQQQRLQWWRQQQPGYDIDEGVEADAPQQQQQGRQGREEYADSQTTLGWTEWWQQRRPQQQQQLFSRRGGSMTAPAA